MLAVGLARNCGPAIRGAVECVSAALVGFERVQWLIIESDSSDDTVARLEALRRERPGFDFESLGELRRTKPLRTDRIAHCRNRYMDQLAEDPHYRDVQTLVVADLDGVNDLLPPETCSRAGTSRAGNDCWRQYEFLKAHGVPRERALHAAMHSRHLRIPEDAPPSRSSRPSAAWASTGARRSGIHATSGWRPTAASSAST